MIPWMHMMAAQNTMTHIIFRRRRGVSTRFITRKNSIAILPNSLNASAYLGSRSVQGIWQDRYTVLPGDEPGGHTAPPAENDVGHRVLRRHHVHPRDHADSNRPWLW